MQHIKAFQALVSRINIRRNVPEWMTDMQPSSRRVREHVEHVIFGLKSYGAGQYLGEFFTYMSQRIDADNQDVEKLLKLRPRHLVKGDIQLGYKKFNVGFTLIYGSYPENIPEVETFAVDAISGEFGATQRYSDAHEKGDLVMNARASYQVFDQLKVSFIVNNLTNRIYSYRPSKVEPIRNFTLQLRATF